MLGIGYVVSPLIHIKALIENSIQLLGVKKHDISKMINTFI